MESHRVNFRPESVTFGYFKRQEVTPFQGKYFAVSFWPWNIFRGGKKISHNLLGYSSCQEIFPVKPRYCRSVLIHYRTSWICSKFLSNLRQFLPKLWQIFQKLFVAALAKIVAALTKVYYISIQFLKKVRKISGFTLCLSGVIRIRILDDNF